MLLNAYGTHQSPPPLDFPHTLRGRRDRTDPELGRHLNGFMGFVMQNGKRAMNQSRYHVLRHLERVHHHVSVEIEPAALPAFAKWARAANAIVFHEDARVTDPDGVVLVDPQTGDAAPGADVPFLDDTLARRAKSLSLLDAKGITTPKSLPPVASVNEVELRSSADVASRAVALFACALRGESLASGEPIAPSDIAKRLPLARAALSPNERTFFEDDAPEHQAVVNHVWRYESLAVLLWSLELLPELPFPTQIADVPAIAKSMLANADPEFPSRAKLRNVEEILGALDLHLRLHWATTDARVKKTPVPGGLEPGAVFERHYALNWLTRFGDADWDDVETPT